MEKNDTPSLDRQSTSLEHHSKCFTSESNATMKHLHTSKSELDDVLKANFKNKKQNKNKLWNVNNYCLDSGKSTLRSSDYLYFPALFFFPTWFSYMINKYATFEEIGQTRGSSAAAIQFSFRNRANFHSRFLCYQCVFHPIPLSTLSLFSFVFAFSSNLICWRPKDMYCRAEN